MMKYLTFLVVSMVAVGTIVLGGHAAGVDDEPATDQRAEIAALEQWVQRTELTYKRVQNLFQNGGPGGTIAEHALVQYHLCVAKSRLALVKGETAEHKKWCKNAVAAAARCAEGTEVAFEEGSVTLDRLLRAYQEHAEAKIRLSKCG